MAVFDCPEKGCPARRPCPEHGPCQEDIDAIRIDVPDEVADVLAKPIPEGAPCEDWECLIELIEQIRGMADEARRKAEPGMHPKEFLRLFLNIADDPKPTP